MGGNSQRFRAVDAYSAPASLVVTGLFDNVATNIDEAIKARVNGQIQTTFSTDTAGAASGSGFRNDSLRLLEQSRTSDNSSNPFYGGVVSTGSISSNDLDALEAYLASLSGVTL